MVFLRLFCLFSIVVCLIVVVVVVCYVCACVREQSNTLTTKRVSRMFDKADMSYTSNSLSSNDNETSVSGIQGYSQCAETD